MGLHHRNLPFVTRPLLTILGALVLPVLALAFAFPDHALASRVSGRCVLERSLGGAMFVLSKDGRVLEQGGALFPLLDRALAARNFGLCRFDKGACELRRGTLLNSWSVMRNMTEVAVFPDPGSAVTALAYLAEAEICGFAPGRCEVTPQPAFGGSAFELRRQGMSLGTFASELEAFAHLSPLRRMGFCL